MMYFSTHKFYFQLLRKASCHADTCFGCLFYLSSWSYNMIKTQAVQRDHSWSEQRVSKPWVSKPAKRDI